VGTSGTAKESAHEAEKSAPIAEQILPSAAASGGEAGGSGRSTVRVVPFQSLPSSTQEELGKKLFDDPLLTMENIQKLAD
jgi:cytochrome c peroxidase